MQRLIIFLLGFTLLACSSSKKNTSTYQYNPYQYQIAKRVEVKNGGVASAHPLASMAGAEMLRKGGNAVDAAIATQWALAVVYPGAGNIGGGGFMIAHLKSGQELALDYRESAPAKAHKYMYLDNKGKPITDLSLYGHLSSGVPGTVAGLFAAHQYAKLPMKTLLQPAIDLAEKGFTITLAEAKSLNAARDAFVKYNTRKTVFVKDWEWKENDTLVQTDLANTLKRIQKKGAAGFYSGETADLIIKEMKRGGGLITKDDLKNYQATWRTPLSFNYRGYDIMSMPMPSSGGLLLLQMMKMLEPYNMSSMKFHSPQAVQLMVEVARRAYADRAKYMGDADFVPVPVSELSSDAYLKKRMQHYTPNTAGNSTVIKEGILPGYESDETTHLSVIDKEGNAVSVTTTLNNVYGSKTVVGGAGFLLNDEMDDFSVKPGSPNLYGAVGGKANAIAPGKRMLSSMTPTIILKNRKPYIVVGSPGGTTIPTSVFQSLVNIIDFNLTADEAVNQPKFHHQWLPDRVDVEKTFPTSTIMALTKMGYSFYSRGQIGRVELIKALPNGKYELVADSRGDDSVAGY